MNLERSGTSVGEVGMIEHDEQSLRHLLELSPRDGALQLRLGQLLRRMRRNEEAVSALRGALQHLQDDLPIQAELALALCDLGRLGEALHLAERMVEEAPEFARGHLALAAALSGLSRMQEAVLAFARCLAIDPKNAAALRGLGFSMSKLGRFAEAAVCYEEAIAVMGEMDRFSPVTLSALVHCRLMQCDWTRLDSMLSSLLAQLEEGPASLVTPFNSQAIPGITPSLSYKLAQRYAAESLIALDATPACKPDAANVKRRGKLRLGYLSSDFQLHATSVLIAGLMEAHDRDGFEIYAYSHSMDDGSLLRQRMVAAFDVFREIGELSDQDAAALIATDQIDILIDLKGWTWGARMDILARRPAPIQVTWLGYPGTLGDARLADYLIGDPLVTPIDDAPWYAEQLALMPHCYQPNDNTREFGPEITRDEVGLPDNAFVFCSFNQHYKINPPVFSAWCELLKRVPNSVLWLLETSDASEQNLRREAVAAGVSGERLVFASKMAPHHHLSRLRLADLALDTMPYNSHTTGADALWAGVPMVTVLGTTFAGRVGASLLHAVHCPELVTSSLDEYVALAAELAQDTERFQTLRRKLAEQRAICPLFDTVRFTRHLEGLYRAMHQRLVDGLPPAMISLSPEAVLPPTVASQRGDVPMQDSVVAVDASEPVWRASSLVGLLQPLRPIEVVDIGANPIDGEPPYRPLLAEGLCHVTGFEPQQDALARLDAMKGPLERYLPYAVGDGQAATLRICKASGMTSLFEPDQATLALFKVLQPLAEVLERVELQTHRLDDLAEIEQIDFLKIDVQGAELMVFQSGQQKLSNAVAIQTEVSFVTLYEGQPAMGVVDVELRKQGFIPHCFAAVKQWPIAPCVLNDNPTEPLNQLLEADIVYIRDITRDAAMTDEQLKHLAIIAHHCYGSYDLALRCVFLLEKRGGLPIGAEKAYLRLLEQL